MKTLATIIFGSRLYELNNEFSDHDLKSIHLPRLEDCLLMEACKNSRNKNEELNIETESFSLQEFLKHCSSAKDYTIDFLHCSQKSILLDSEIFKYLRQNKSKFYTKRMAGALGYAKSQSTHYALRAERLEAAEKVLKVLIKAEIDGVARLHQIWDELPRGDYIWVGDEERNNGVDKRFYEVSGKKLQATCAIPYCIEIIRHLIDSYGNRVKSAREMDNNDVKSLSHAFRMGYELLHIYQDQGFEFPLPETQFLLDVKYKRLDYLMDKLDEQLHELVSRVEQLAEKSSYPDKIDKKWMDSIILNAYGYMPIKNI